MSIRFRCQHCRTKMAASDRWAGARVKCKKCGEVVVVPQSAAAPTGKHAGKKKLPTTTAFSAALLEDEDDAEPPFHFRRRRVEGEGELDMTPMVDVTFLLLIFFMVTAAFRVEAAIRAEAAEQETAAVQSKPIEELLDDSDYIIVYVNSDNTYLISASFWDDEKDAPSDQEMLIRLREARRGDGNGRPPNKLLIMASANARNDKVIKVNDEGIKLGMEEIRIEMVEEDY